MRKDYMHHVKGVHWVLPREVCDLFLGLAMKKDQIGEALKKATGKSGKEMKSDEYYV
jgi:hypothetical protein